MQDVIALHALGAARDRDLHRPSKLRSHRDPGLAGAGTHLHQIKCVRLKTEIADNRQCAGWVRRIAGRQCAASADSSPGAERAGARQRGARTRERRTYDRTIHLQRAAEHEGWARIGVVARERERAGTNLDDRDVTYGSNAGDHAGEGGREIVAADGYLIVPKIDGSSALDRAGADIAVAIGSGAGGKIECRVRITVNQARIAAGAVVAKIDRAAIGDRGAAGGAGAGKLHKAASLVDDVGARSRAVVE